MKKKPASNMGAMFRSEEMTLCQMFIQPEAGYSSVSELGETGAVQFRDVSTLTRKNEFISWQKHEMMKIFVDPQPFVAMKGFPVFDASTFLL